jgi:hypothetical protein
LVDPLEDTQVITTRWIFKPKRGALGEVKKFKVRLVACGFQQTERVDYFDTYALGVCWSTITTVIVIIAKIRWSIRHLDVKITFLNGSIEEEVYMHVPKGFHELGIKRKLCKLK